MNDPRPQSALREWRVHFSQPTTLVALLGVAAVLAIAGPFGTGEHLSLVPRALYWLGVVAATYSVGFLASEWVRALLAGKVHRAVVVLVAGLVTGCGVALVVMLANALTFGIWPTGAQALPFLATTFPVALIITAVLDYLSGSTGGGPATPPAILDRLPLDKRGALVALSVEDHYVRVRTVKGEEMLLMRLSDAMKEVGDTSGAQVHRSHWVAFDQVTAARREGDRAILTVTRGPDIPVSRANLSKIREAGLLPR